MVPHCSSAVFSPGTLGHWPGPVCVSVRDSAMAEQHFPILELSGDSAEKDLWEITSVHTTDLGTFCRNVLLNHPGNQPKCKSQLCRKNPKKGQKGRCSLTRRKTSLSTQWYLGCVWDKKEKNGMLYNWSFWKRKMKQAHTQPFSSLVYWGGCHPGK